MENRRTEPYMSTYLHARGGKLGLPISGNFELTARCNFNCPMCYVHLSQEDVDAAGKELTAQQWIELARQAKDRGLVFALLTGGEPFVRKDFFEIFDAMKAMGILISINSNGSMLEGAILERLIENPPFRINVSLYGGCPETYQTMCGQNAFDRVVNNIRRLKEAGIDVRVNCSITPYNRQDIEKIHRICQELGVHVKGSSYMYPSIRTGSDYGCGNRLTPKEAGECSALWDSLRFTPEEFEQRADNMKKYIGMDKGECSADLDEGVSCRAGHTSFWVTWDGRMLPCGMMPYPTVYPMETGFDAAWDELRVQTRALRMPSECASCAKRDICPVCAAVCVTETGAFDKVPEYMCQFTDEMVGAMCRMKEERMRDK